MPGIRFAFSAPDAHSVAVAGTFNGWDTHATPLRREAGGVWSVNVPLDALPTWMQEISKVLPLTHGIQAAREVADGSTLGDVSGLVWTEALIGVAYASVAYALLRLFEFDGRRRASLETM